MLDKSLSFSQIMIRDKGHTNGFDYLRLFLAIGVLVIHVTNISDYKAWFYLWNSWTAPFERSILPAFFALSGFLVAGSLSRNTILGFLVLRAVRILPALTMIVFLTAFLLGPLLTDLSVSAYLISPMQHAYLLNILGYMHFSLPGVYEGRPINIPLWTIPFEASCYALLAITSIVGLIRHKNFFLVSVVTVLLAMTAFAVFTTQYQANWNVPGRALPLCFICGVLGFLFKEKISHSPKLFVLSAISTYACLSFPNLVFLATPPLAYLTLYLGLFRLPRISFGDLSYGTYLFHYPVARILYEATGEAMTWQELLPLTVILSLLIAYLSWKFIEKPAIDNKTFALLTARNWGKNLLRLAGKF